MENRIWKGPDEVMSLVKKACLVELRWMVRYVGRNQIKQYVVGFVYMMSLDFILIAMRRHSGDLIEDWHDCIYILKSFLWLACGKWAKWKPMMAPGKQVRRLLTIFQVREDGKEPGGQCSIEMVRLGINVRSTATRSFWWLGPWEMTEINQLCFLYLCCGHMGTVDHECRNLKGEAVLG